MSYKVMVHGCGDPEGRYTCNAMRFATREEADSYEFDLGCRWFGYDDARIEKCDDPVNGAWKDGKLVHLSVEIDV